MSNCKHVAVKSIDVAYRGTAPGAREENRAAHGGIAVEETCRCGAERIVNVNGTHTEKGAWCSPELSVGIRRYEERIAALGGYGVRVRAVGAVDGAPREGRLIELGSGGCQPGIEADDGRRYLIRLDSLERAAAV